MLILLLLYVWAVPMAIPAWHPDIDKLLANRTLAPSDHPLIHSNLSIASNTFTNRRGHPNVDNLIKTNSRLPSGHPKINPYLSYAKFVYTPYRVVLPWWHLDIDALWKNKTSTPIKHPLIHKYFTDFIPKSHPNIDTLIANPKTHPMPIWHPVVFPFVGYNKTRPSVIVDQVPEDHPPVILSYRAGTRLPQGHKLVHAKFAAVPDLLPDNHPNIDALLSNVTRTPMPSWHPSIDGFIGLRSAYTPIQGVTLPRWHPNIDTKYQMGQALPAGHVSVQQLFKDVLPSGHPNVDTLLNNPQLHPLPYGHMALSSLVPRSTSDAVALKVRIPSWHPDIDTSYRNGEAVPATHLKFHKLFQSVLPPNHPDIDQLMRDPDSNRMPADHETIMLYTIKRPKIRPGHKLAIFLAVLFLVVALSKLFYRLFKSTKLPKDHQKFQLTELDREILYSSPKDEIYNSQSSLIKSTHPMTPMGEMPTIEMVSQDEITEQGPRTAFAYPKPTETDRRSSLTKRRLTTKSTKERDPIAIESGEPIIQMEHRAVPPPLPRRNLFLMQSQLDHAKHKSEPLYDYNHQLPDAPHTTVTAKMCAEEMEKKSSKTRSLVTVLLQYRIPNTDWTISNALFLLGYVILNLLALVPLEKESLVDDIPSMVGSLAAANTMLLVIPATRNSILTWFLGLPFDHVVLYHRWMGRFTLSVALVHLGLYAQSFTTNLTEFVYWSGITALLFGSVIFVTSLDWMRRQKFNIFFFAHYSFAGFYLFAFLHVQEARPFLWIGLSLYLLDKLLRLLWTQLPRQTLVFKPKGNICQVRFPKNWIIQQLGQDRVGQYYFVNFPGLSWHEWHPFSVSSGPNEDSVELNIRALGDHTREILEFAKRCEKSASLPMIRCDGPYGLHDFNYRRYPVLLLVGGGIGITPVIGMLKDIYHVGDYKKPPDRVEPHCMESVYVAWVLPNEDDAHCFMTELQQCMRNSHLPQLPHLVVWIYITKSKSKLVEPLIAGRPEFNKIFEAIVKNHQKKAVLTFACGPSRMVAELWDHSIRLTAKGNRVDFHHETFEF